MIYGIVREMNQLLFIQLEPKNGTKMVYSIGMEIFLPRYQLRAQKNGIKTVQFTERMDPPLS
jgi:hypothetical protein